jgi:glyoxylase-like metal-dependent hydrolase (beta-lactamase superfamily II)
MPWNIKIHGIIFLCKFENMKMHVINTGMFRLDGGAMFGVVPKSIWSKFSPSDENNLCTWAMRCLLIEDGNRLILIDSGIGDKQDKGFLNHYYLHGDYSLHSSLMNSGFLPEDITDVFLTHLHFDHCGGGVQWKDQNKHLPEMTFKNAVYWSNQEHWDWATNPNQREKASFLPENIIPMKVSGQLQMISPGTSSPFSNIDIIYMDGHTEKQMLPVIKYKNKVIVFAADLIPSAGHIPVPYIMSYDTRPLISMNEKSVFLKTAFDKNYILFFEHDPVHECCSLQETEKGIRANEFFKLSEI